MPLLLVLFLTAACSAGNDYPEISLNKQEVFHEIKRQPANEDAPSLNIALASITSARESLYYYNDLLEYLEAAVDMPVKIIQRKTYSEVNELIKNGTVDLGFICTYSYVLGREDFGMELLAAPIKDGKMEYYSYIIVQKELEAGNFYDLKDASFAFTDPISNSGRLYALYLLKEIDKNPDSFFREYIYTFSHDNSIRAVAEGLVDAAAVDSLVYDHLYDQDPSYFENIDIIQVSQPFGIQPIVVHPNSDENLKIILQDFFITLHQTPRGQEILYNLGLEQFGVPDDAAYDSIREIAEVVGLNATNW